MAANEDVLVWDIKRGETDARWHATNNRAQVTVIRRSQSDPDVFAVGYDDGKIRIWDSRTVTILMTFNGHKSGITELVFDRAGVRLASGSRDTSIILWDLVAEVGLYKFRGHKDQITSLNFISGHLDKDLDKDEIDDQVPTEDSFLLSTSKDALIKIWDLSMQHCIETHVTQSNGECWALGLSPEQDGCITAGNDGEMRAWVLDKQALMRVSRELGSEEKILRDRGVFFRNGKDRTTAILFHPKRNLLAIHGSEKAVELWRIRSEEEIKKSLSRKKKRKREKLGADAEMDEGEGSKEVDLANILITEILVPYVIIRTGGRVRSIDWAGGKSSKSASILVATTSNQLELYSVETREKKSKHQPDYDRSLSVDMPGHRSDIRCLALSSDDRMLASASQGSLKVWNTRTQSCLRTLDCGHALCLSFLPGDKIIVLGTRDGTLELFDITSSSLIDTISAHDRDIWALHVHPSGHSIVTGSADKTAKFWDLKVVQEEVLGTNRKVPKLTLVHTRTLKTADDILAVQYSPDAKYLALSTLDTTVKIFHTDTLNPYLTLYGHKLPVLSLSISSDSKLIVTSSADKTCRVWGLDFGDCHKTFLAHNDSILAVSFIPTNADGNHHHFFSASKDRTIKYYDGDKFEQIQKLEGHHGEIWAMTVSHSGQFIATASHDKSIRIWTQTDEQIFLEEEREKELEELYENTLLTSLDAEEDQPPRNGDDTDTQLIESTDPTKQTADTLTAAEKISEALTLGTADLDLLAAHARQVQFAREHNTKPPAPPPRHPLYVAHNNISSSAYLLQLLTKLPPQALTDSLLLLPFAQLPALLTFLALLARDQPRTIPLVCRVLAFVLRAHHRQLVSSRLMRAELDALRTTLRAGMDASRREMGFNLAGLRVLGRRMEGELAGLGYVDGAEEEEQEEPEHGERGKKGKKRSFVNVA